WVRPVPRGQRRTPRQDSSGSELYLSADRGGTALPPMLPADSATGAERGEQSRLLPGSELSAGLLAGLPAELSGPDRDNQGPCADRVPSLPLLSVSASGPPHPAHGSQ